MRPHTIQLAILAVLLSFLSGGCTQNLTRFFFGSSPPPHIPELDNYVINLERIQRTSSQEDVRAILGEPPFVYETYGDGDLQWTTWWYPIRHIAAAPLPTGAKAQRQVIPAVQLKIWIDTAGRVYKWGFFHPIKNSRMEIHESIEQADAWFRDMCNPPKRIELANLLRQGTPKEEVTKGMRWFERSLISKDWERSQVQVSREGQEEIIIYFADHPSPLYVPSHYVVVTFHAIGGLDTRSHFEGWGGCK